MNHAIINHQKFEVKNKLKIEWTTIGRGRRTGDDTAARSGDESGRVTTNYYRFQVVAVTAAI